MPAFKRLRRQESNLRRDGSEPPARANTGPTAVSETRVYHQKLGEKGSNLHFLVQSQAACH